MIDNLLARLARVPRDDEGAEVSELAVVLALIVAGAVATIALIGPIITQYYSDLHTAISGS